MLIQLNAHTALDAEREAQRVTARVAGLFRNVTCWGPLEDAIDGGWYVWVEEDREGEELCQRARVGRVRLAA